VGDWENTRCPKCNELLIERFGFEVQRIFLTDEGKCPKCATAIPGRWDAVKTRAALQRFSPLDRCRMRCRRPPLQMSLPSGQIWEEQGDEQDCRHRRKREIGASVCQRFAGAWSSGIQCGPSGAYRRDLSAHSKPTSRILGRRLMRSPIGREKMRAAGTLTPSCISRPFLRRIFLPTQLFSRTTR